MAGIDQGHHEKDSEEVRRWLDEPGKNEENVEREDEYQTNRLTMDATDWPTRHLVGDIRRIAHRRLRPVDVLEVIEAIRHLRPGLGL